jgi:hypothetical protein
MISVRIEHKARNDNYARLANYVRDAKKASAGQGIQREMPDGIVDNYRDAAEYIFDAPAERTRPGEKVLYAWYDGCVADTYELSVREVVATQAMNSRVKTGKTYHLVVSFRPEDEPKLTEEVCRRIEKTFAKALGYEEHQRHCGVHKNTDNIHLHIAYNMIHPHKLTKHSPWRDYLVRDMVHKVLSEEFGLAQDNGIGEAARHRREVESQRARAMEAQTGQESFARYVGGKRGQVLSAVCTAGSWGEFHAELARHGLEYALRGNGAVIRDAQGKHACKASAVDKELSLSAMTKRLGEFQAAELSREERKTLEQSHYEARPLKRGAERDALWQEYQTAIQDRISRLKVIADKEKARLELLDSVFAQSREGFDAGLIKGDYGKPQLTRLYRESWSREKEKKGEIAREYAAEREQVKTDVPFSSWKGFLQGKASQGDERALEILRRRQRRPEEEISPEKDRDLERRKMERRKIREKWRTEQQRIRNNAGLKSQAKRELVSVLKMKQLESLEAFDGKTGRFQGMTYEISKQGTVVFHLPCGELRDTGDRVYPRGQTGELVKAALSFARTKWGPDVKQDRETGAFMPMSREEKQAMKKMSEKGQMQGI